MSQLTPIWQPLVRRLALAAVVLLVIPATEAWAQRPGKTNPGPTAPPRKGSSIVNDTVRNVYGPNTTKYTTEKSLFYNQNVYVPIDTSFINLHRWTYIQKFNNFYKDLGNLGTALSPIYPTISTTIGANSGFNSYTPYYDTEEPKYFDTKSPYTNLHIIWGGNGRAMTKVEFSRNVHARWNFGINYRPIWVDRQIQRQKSTRQTVSQYYDFYTTYKSKDDKYLLLANYRRMRHRVSESGGVVLPAGGKFADYFDPNAKLNFAPVLGGGFSTGAITEYYHSEIHVLQQYKLAKPFQVYNILDIGTQANRFTYAGTLASGIFDYSQGDSTNNKDVASLKTVVTEAGTKGNAGPLFYDYYFKLRSYNYQNFFQQQTESILAVQSTGLEKYIGGRMALRFDSLTELSGTAEYLLDGHYRIEGDWRSRWLDASVRSSLSRPGFMQNNYKGSHNQWSNNFSSIGSQQLAGFIKVNAGPLFFSPGATFTTLSNYIYFKQVENPSVYQQVLPYRSNFQILFAPEARFSITALRRLTLSSRAIYSKLVKNDGGALQIPELFVNGQIAYNGIFFKGALNLQVGVDAHWQSAYYALGYATAIQQFYVQTTTTTPSFPLADLFLNAKLKRGRLFVKYQNIVQAVTKSGYLPTPGYPGQTNLLDFGFIMLLFD